MQCSPRTTTPAWQITPRRTAFLETGFTRARVIWIAANAIDPVENAIRSPQLRFVRPTWGADEGDGPRSP